MVEKSSFQDDQREKAMRELFQLVKDPDEGRSGIDAFLNLEPFGNIPFELKTTSDPRGSVTTVRDFGKDHIEKWKNKHWLFGFFGAKDGKEYYQYASPKDMKPWIDEMAEYVKPDYLLTSIVAGKLTEADLQEVVGSAVAGVYPLTTAQSLHKKQYKLEEYIDRCNVVEFKNEIVLKLLQGRKRDPLSENQLEEIFKLASVEVRHESSYPLGEVVKLLKAQEHPKAEDYVWLKKRADSLGYSTERMLEILKERATYLMERGSTLNNPHISGSYFHGWPRIENNYADELRKKVRKYLESVSS